MFSIGIALLSLAVVAAVIFSFNTLKIMLIIHSSYVRGEYDGGDDIIMKIGVFVSSISWGIVTAIRAVVLG